eukprot:TRINITY_DN1011_c0_g1_i1.p1 TRINITY_DN1011_c0_g1~~TRINITY_DN1011_c0_g1_i1.p1  ORF type:complete len:106 (+),score=47.99 TRINITY_DN1011_c0_g1_i1:534-851(+)
MPDGGDPLSEDDIAEIKAWIDAGATKADLEGDSSNVVTIIKNAASAHVDGGDSGGLSLGGATAQEIVDALVDVDSTCDVPETDGSTTDSAVVLGAVSAAVAFVLF